MRYRFITCGRVFPDDPVSHFRLIGGRNMTGQNIAIRITIPDGVKLKKYSCDSYSTWDADKTTKVQDLDPVLMVRINRRWEKTEGFWPARTPAAVHDELVMAGYWFDTDPRKGYIRVARKD